MTENSKLIRAALGPRCEQFNYELDGQTHTGWVTFVDRGESLPPCPSALEIVSRHSEELRGAGVQILVGGGGSHVGEERLFEADAVFALPGLNTLDVVDFARTGSHNAPIWETWDERQTAFGLIGIASIAEALRIAGMSENHARESYSRTPHGRTPWKIVRRALEQFISEFPFNIYYADESGLAAAFREVPRGDAARRVAEGILDVAPESSDAIEGRLEELGLTIPVLQTHGDISDPRAATALYIEKTGGFSLWWD